MQSAKQLEIINLWLITIFSNIINDNELNLIKIISQFNSKIISAQNISNSNELKLYENEFDFLFIGFILVLTLAEDYLNILTRSFLKIIISKYYNIHENYIISKNKFITFLSDFSKNLNDRFSTKYKKIIFNKSKIININDLINNIKNLQSKTISGRINGNLLETIQDIDIKFNMYFRTNISFNLISSMYNINEEDDIIKDYDSTNINPFSKKLMINNDYKINDIDFNKLCENPLIKKFGLKKNFNVSKRVELKKNIPLSHDLVFKTKFQTCLSFDNLIDENSSDLIRNINIADKNMYGFFRLGFLPIASLIKYLKEHNVLERNINGNIYDFIYTQLNEHISIKDFLDNYYYLPLKNDFFDTYFGDLKIFDSKDLHFFKNSNTLELVINHLLNMPQNSETIIAISKKNIEIYNDITNSLKDPIIRPIIIKNLNNLNEFTSLLSDFFIFYETSFGKIFFDIVNETL